MSNIRDIIDNAARVRVAEEIAGEQKASVWAALKEDAPQKMLATAPERSRMAEDWLESLQPYEDGFMEDNFSHVPEAKKKDGSWKYRAYKDEHGKSVPTLPPEYVSAKSVIKGCILNGIDVHLDLGKSEAQKKIREAKESTNPASAWDKVQKYLSAVENNWDALSVQEREDARQYMETNFSVTVNS
jgi:hypothetical protein